MGLGFLDDVVVLDLGDEATALAGSYLAELGATVVRVEDRRGDVLRRRGGLWHAVHNAGKRSVAIDTTSDDDWAGVEAALGGVDVVIGPLEPNPATARFLDRVVRIGGPRIGLVDVVFRRDHDREPVTDLTLGAAGGFTVLNGFSEDPPNQAAGDLAFKQVALATAEAAMALVTARRVTGRAGRIVVSAQEAVARHDVPDVERQPLPLARDGAGPPRSDRRRVDGPQRGRAVDVVHDPPAELPALRRVGRARHRADGALAAGVGRPGLRRPSTATS